MDHEVELPGGSKRIMDEKSLPKGWKRVHDGSGRYYYLTRQPQVKITKKFQLESYHKAGRYKEMRLDRLDFGIKQRRKNFSVARVETVEVVEEPIVCMETVAEEVFANVVMEMKKKETSKEEESEKQRKLKREQMKLERAVQKLTIDPSHQVDHEAELRTSAKLLNRIRLGVDKDLDVEITDMQSLRSQIVASDNVDEVLKTLRNFPEIQIKISKLEQSKILEQFVRLSSIPDNPLADFPANINSNIYSNIINFAAEHAPDALSLILHLCIKNEDPISESDVVRLAYLFSSVATAVSSRNNAMKKIKSIATKNSGLTNSGLDILSKVGVFETSRTWRNDRDLFASLSDEILRSHAKFSVSQVTFDNMDINIANVMHHMTLPFIEFEKVDTSHLSTQEKTFEEALEYFVNDTVDITAEVNREQFDHYKYVTANVLGRLFGSEVEGFSWLCRIFPKHYKHPNSGNASNKSIIFTQKPLNYSENSNADMIKIMEILQWQYLNLVGEQVGDKSRYKHDLKKMYNSDEEKTAREQAEDRVKEDVKKAGVMICHGDLLTDVRFEACKRLRRMCVSAVERFDFMNIFRLGTFHLHMNKIIQDIGAGMKQEVNVDDTLSLGFFKTIMGLSHISNQPDFIKKDGNFEAHSQFCEDIGKEMLIEAFKTYIKNPDCPIVKSETGSVNFMLGFLKYMKIDFFFDPNKEEDEEVFDDMEEACRDMASRTLISMVLKTVEHEADGLGLRAVRTVMIPYFLNRKEETQDSKYAPRLLYNRIAFLQASDKTKARVDSLACCNPSGKIGRAIARDQQNEHKVKNTKHILRGRHGQLTDLTVEKAVLGSNVLEMIEGHDRQAMLLDEEGGKSSHRYLNETQVKKIREHIMKNAPFNTNRQKVEYYEKPRSAFSGLTATKVERFIVRNKKLYKRNSPHRNNDGNGGLNAAHGNGVLEEEAGVEGASGGSLVGSCDYGPGLVEQHGEALNDTARHCHDEKDGKTGRLNGVACTGDYVDGHNEVEYGEVGASDD